MRCRRVVRFVIADLPEDAVASISKSGEMFITSEPEITYQVPPDMEVRGTGQIVVYDARGETCGAYFPDNESHWKRRRIHG